MNRTAFKKKARMKRSAEKGGDETYLTYVRSLPCCAPTIYPCRNPSPQHAHHPRTGVGLALKAPDREAIPLCWLHHKCLHDLRGPFEHFNREMLRAWQRTQADRTRRDYRSVPAALEKRGETSDEGGAETGT